MDGIKKTGKTLVACIILAGLCSTCLGKVIYVDDDAIGRADGSSWVNAFPFLQDALAVAGQGDEVRVAQGVYRPNQGASIQPRKGPTRRPPITVQATDPDGQYLAFQLKNEVALMGGFAGLGAQDPNARDVARHQTILSGDLHNNDVAGWGPDNPVFESTRADNGQRVVTGMNVNSTAVLDGFILEAATNSAMATDNASPRVVNCTFRSNYATRYSGAPGSALRCSGGQPSLSNCVFEGNFAYQGGAILSSTESFSSALPARLTLSLSGCRFTGNWTTGIGGAIYSMGGDLVLTGCTFERNAAERGGAIYLAAGTLTLTDCIFEGNAAGNDGGAISAVRPATAAMTRCVFKRNWSFSSGGAVRSEGASVTLSACALSGNSAPYGGALHAYLARSPAGGGDKVVLAQCLFTGNRASSEGGALYIPRSGIDSAINSCTFADNWASTGSTLGGSGGSSVPHIALNNCIVWDGKGSISSNSAAKRPPAETPKDASVAITYSDVQGGWPGVGNIDADPLFAAPGHWVDAVDPKAVVDGSYAYAVWVDGDYHVKSQAGRWDPQTQTWVVDDVTSPCIDAGDPNTPVGDEPVPNGGRINLGAYGGTAEASESS